MFCSHVFAHLSVLDDLHVGARRREAQLTKIALEVAVHLGCVVPLALRLLHVQFGLLWNIERNVYSQ